MKKSIFSFLAICLIFAFTANGQKANLLKKVTNAVTNEVAGKPEKSSSQPEPSCACDQAEIVMDMSGKLQLDYRELSISVLDDGRVLAKNRASGDYYIVRAGVTDGPYKSGDPKIADFEAADNEDNSSEGILLKNKQYISRSGEKFLITFGGKKYGPFSKIEKFAITKSKEKFAALVVENEISTEDQAKKMEQAMKNAKTDQERMDISMQYAQEMQKKMMQGGGPASIMPKLVTNVPNATIDPMKAIGASGDVKYDDILVIEYDKLLDLQGRTVITIKPEAAGSDVLFVNTSNTKYAVGGYGNLTFSDNTTLSELFNPHLVKDDGKIYLAYMYFSPKRNAIMQCKILF
jgi:hypothetical protein